MLKIENLTSYTLTHYGEGQAARNKTFEGNLFTPAGEVVTGPLVMEFSDHIVKDIRGRVKPVQPIALIEQWAIDLHIEQAPLLENLSKLALSLARLAVMRVL